MNEQTRNSSLEAKTTRSNPWIPFGIGFIIGFLAGVVVLGILLLLYLIPVTRATG